MRGELEEKGTRRKDASSGGGLLDEVLALRVAGGS